MNTNTDGGYAMSAELGALLDAKVVPGKTGYSLGAMRAAYERGYAEGAKAERSKGADLADEYSRLIWHMDKGGDFDEFMATERKRRFGE